MGDVRFMRRALALACESVASGGGPFGAVVVRDGEVVAEGVNRVTVWKDPTAHAEVVAVRGACSALGRFDLRGCEVYSSCEPCPMCLGALHWARVGRIFFCATRFDAARAGFDDAALYDEFSVTLAERAMPIGQMLAEEAGGPFEVWGRFGTRTGY